MIKIYLSENITTDENKLIISEFIDYIKKKFYIELRKKKINKFLNN